MASHSQKRSQHSICKVSSTASTKGAVPWELAMLRPQAHPRAEQAGPSYFSQSSSTYMCGVCAHVCTYMHVYLSAQLVFVENATVLGPEQRLWICDRERHAHFPQGFTVRGINDSHGQCCDGEVQEVSDHKIARSSSAKVLCYRRSIGARHSHPSACLQYLSIYLSIYLSMPFENNALDPYLFSQCMVTVRRVTFIKFPRLSDIIFGNKK